MMEVTNDLIRYFDMFAGIGGFRAGLTRAGVPQLMKRGEDCRKRPSLVVE